MFLMKVAMPSVYLAVRDLSIAFQHVSAKYLTMHHFHQLLTCCTTAVEDVRLQYNNQKFSEDDVDDAASDERGATIGNQCDRTRGL